MAERRHHIMGNSLSKIFAENASRNIKKQISQALLLYLYLICLYKHTILSKSTVLVVGQKMHESRCKRLKSTLSRRTSLKGPCITLVKNWAPCISAICGIYYTCSESQLFTDTISNLLNGSFM